MGSHWGLHRVSIRISIGVSIRVSVGVSIGVSITVSIGVSIVVSIGIYWGPIGFILGSHQGL